MVLGKESEKKWLEKDKNSAIVEGFANDGEDKFQSKADKKTSQEIWRQVKNCVIIQGFADHGEASGKWRRKLKFSGGSLKTYSR